MALGPGYETDTKTGVEQTLVRGIIQKEYTITNSKSDKPIIGTFGLGPCIALTGYDPETSTAVIAHIDATTDIQSLAEIFTDIGIDSKGYNRLRIGLIGGNYSSRRKVNSSIPGKYRS